MIAFYRVKMGFHKNSYAFQIVLAGLFTSLTALGAFIRIPFFPVPLTLQTLFTLLAGSMLLPGLAALSQAAYLLLGLAGLPVFASGGGPGYILQPTFGYLLSLPMAAYVMARIRTLGKWHGTRSLVLINVIGLIIIFFVGVLWLYFTVNHVIGTTLSFRKAIFSGAIVFIPGDLVKVAMAVTLTRIYQNRIITQEV